MFLLLIIRTQKVAFISWTQVFFHQNKENLVMIFWKTIQNTAYSNIDVKQFLGSVSPQHIKTSVRSNLNNLIFSQLLSRNHLYISAESYYSIPRQRTTRWAELYYSIPLHRIVNVRPSNKRMTMPEFTSHFFVYTYWFTLHVIKTLPALLYIKVRSGLKGDV